MKSKSVLICYIAVCVCVVGVVALCVLAPFLIDGYTRWRGISGEIGRIILIAYYLCCVPTLLALGCLLRLLRNIRKQQIFIHANTRLLCMISWCCVAVSAFCLVAGLWYFPLLFVTAAMLFIFLIVRVVSTCFIAAEELREENSLTI